MNSKIHIKDYQIHLPPLGEGTFGTVYRATYRGISERALKIFKSDVVDLPTMARELEKLSSVAEHPGIITLHDFDLLTNTPYYSMGLHADHLPDDSWRSRSLEDICGQLDAREAERVMYEVSHAVAYLHRHQIIHCDLKPTNVLLTDENPPRIKICDFGQSRASNLRSVDAAGTPLYSAPEQLRHPEDSAEGKGFRWDVYSWGVLCYKLVTGRLPRLQQLQDGDSDMDLEATVFDATMHEDITIGESTNQMAERVAILLEREPEIEWLSGLRIRSEFRDLITRCLSLDPLERPADMREVRNEILRHRHEQKTLWARQLVAVFATVTILAIGASVLALTQASRARKAIEAEQLARQDAEELVNFILFDLREKLRPIGKQELLEHIAGNAETYFDNLSRDMRTAESLKSLAAVLQSRGDGAVMRGDLEDAITNYDKAARIMSSLAQNSEGDRSWLSHRASTMYLNLGATLEDSGRAEEALAALEYALEIRDEKMPGSVPAPVHHHLTARIYLALANHHHERGDVKKATSMLEDSLIAARVTVELDSQRPATYLAFLMGVLLRAGEIHEQAGDFDRAEKWYLEVLTAGRSNLALFLGDDVIRDMAARSMHHLGTLNLALGAPLDALGHFREEVLILEQLLQKEPNHRGWLRRLAEAHGGLATCFDVTSPANKDLALTNYNRAVNLLEQRLEMSDPTVKRMAETYRLAIRRIYEAEE